MVGWYIWWFCVFWYTWVWFGCYLVDFRILLLVLGVLGILLIISVFECFVVWVLFDGLVLIWHILLFCCVFGESVCFVGYCVLVLIVDLGSLLCFGYLL